MVEIPSEFTIRMIDRSNNVVSRAKAVEENWLSQGTHWIDLDEGELLINKKFVEVLKRVAFAAYTDARNLIK